MTRVKKAAVLAKIVRREKEKQHQLEQGETKMGESSDPGKTSQWTGATLSEAEHNVGNGDKANTEMKASTSTSNDDDEYEYTKRDPNTSELYKVFIKHISPRFGFGECKKKLQSLDLNPVKLKKWQNRCYVTFRNEEEREKAIEKLDGLNWKGNILKAMKALPAPDPLVKKRKQDKEAEGSGDQKKVKPEDEGTPAERLRNSVTPMWNIPYEDQLKKKEEAMQQFLKRFHREFEKNCPDLYSWLKERARRYNGLCCELQEIIPSPETEGYRNKCEFTIGPGGPAPDGKESVVGFRYGQYARGNIYVGPPDEVSFLPPATKTFVKAFQSYIDASSYKAWNPEDHSGNWRQLALRTSRLGHMMAMCDFHPQQLKQEDIEEEIERLKKYFQSGRGADSRVTTLYFRSHTERMTGATTDSPYKLLFGEEHITESLLGMKFRISPSSFFQVNTAGAEILYTKVAEWCGNSPNTTVLDICCGTGTIGQSLAKSVAKVIGVEMCSEAIEDAKFNASVNEISNVEYHCAKVEEMINRITRPLFGNKDVVAILDPPRGGLNSSVIQTIRNCRSINRLIYVSCNPNGALNNLVDLIRPRSKRMKAPRFYPAKAVPVDLFPSTSHCELVVLFEREDEREEEIVEPWVEDTIEPNLEDTG